MIGLRSLPPTENTMNDKVTRGVGVDVDSDTAITTGVEVACGGD
jgi:hypothetical protein